MTDFLTEKNMLIETCSDNETFALAERLAASLEEGCVITLEGDLGAGKTVFAKGFAKGLGISEPVTSPTFTILQEYNGGRLPMYHFDLYRLEDPDEFSELGFEEYLNGDGFCLIEWPGAVSELLPENSINITITRKDDDPVSGRSVFIKADGRNLQI